MFLLRQSLLVTLALLRFVRSNTPEIDLVHYNLTSITDTVVAQGAFVILQLCRKCLTLAEMVSLVQAAHQAHSRCKSLTSDLQCKT